jgi:hypothetical protein
MCLEIMIEITDTQDYNILSVDIISRRHNV